MDGFKATLLLMLQLLAILVATASAQLCLNVNDVTCTVQDEVLLDKTVGRTCVCAGASCIPKLNPCPGVQNIKFTASTVTFIHRNAFQNYTSLNSVDISGNIEYIQQMAFASHTLRFLRVYGKQLQGEMGIFLNLNNLEILQINLAKLIHKGIFIGLGTSLRNLDLGSGINIQLDEDVFNTLTNLTQLSLSNNQLKTLNQQWFSKLTQLDELNLSKNNITTVPSTTFRNQTKLRKLNLEQNDINVLQQGCFDGLHLLEELLLTGNKLEYISNPFLALSSLRKLYLDENLFKTINKQMFNGLSSLQTLSLSGNIIGSITAGAFSLLTSLQSLDLSRNHLKTLQNDDIDSLHEITEISFSYNTIKEITNGTFNNVKALKYLSLENNQLQTFSFFDFHNEHRLHRLSLQNNNITTLSFSTTFRPSQLWNLQILWLENNHLTTFPSLIFDYAPRLAIGRNSLHLYDNPLKCDCNMKDLIESTRNIILDSGSNCVIAKCSKPTATVNEPIIAVPIGENVRLICRVSGQPHPLVSWTVHDHERIEGTYDPIVGETYLSFNKVLIRNYGNYTCTVTNRMGTAEVTIQLVEGKTEKESQESYDIAVGKDKNGSGFLIASRNLITLLIGFLLSNFRY